MANLIWLDILNGDSIHSTNHSHTWMDPSQIITNKFKLSFTYQVSAWVRLGSFGCGPQNVSVAIGVDDQWVNGGQKDGRERESLASATSTSLRLDLRKRSLYKAPEPWQSNPDSKCELYTSFLIMLVGVIVAVQGWLDSLCCCFVNAWLTLCDYIRTMDEIVKMIEQ
ncbi:carbohydrate-binding, CenC-like protein [Tanacetum coccineum]